MSESMKILIVFLFYGGLAFALFVRVKGNMHSSRGIVKSYLLVLGAILLSIFVTALLIWGVVYLLGPQNSTVATGFGSGALILSIVRSWQWSFSIIATPIQGYAYQESTQEPPLGMIPKSEYISKYRMSEKKLMTAIASGKVRSSIESGHLCVEDKQS
jgi:hypothetical protein